jgi:hypothetical protein
MLANGKASIMKKGEPQLISASTILILSGFLIGLTVGKIVSENLSPYVLSCGLAGFLAFMALELTGTQREEQTEHEEQVHVQGRLDRHVLSLSSMNFSLPNGPSTGTSDHLEMSSISQSRPIDLQKLDDLYDQLMNLDENPDSVPREPISSTQA